MRGSVFDEEAFFRAIQESGARALLIGRRALIALGLPVNTFDYDLWIHRDDGTLLNDALAAFELTANRDPEEARTVGRYVLEADERVDVLVAKGVQTVDGQMVWFDEVWPRRQEIRIADGVTIAVPSLDDLILTKKFGSRPRDAEDIRLLQLLKEGRST